MWLYLKFPDNRWSDIEKAEKISPQGDKIWRELREEYLIKYAYEE